MFFRRHFHLQEAVIEEENKLKFNLKGKNIDKKVIAKKNNNKSIDEI